MDTPVEHLLMTKGSHVVTIHRSASVADAAALMVDNGVGCVVVIDGTGVAGIFSERDCLIRIVLEQRAPGSTRVGEVMTRNIHIVTPETSIRDCMDIMTEDRCRHLPVAAGGTLVGMISIGDCVAHLCDVASEENGLLRQYIGGERLTAG